MLQVLKNKFKALALHDEGFAIAMTILVWPLMLLTVSGIFVTGETIRQKMILQNAADAAAHAGAMVQADTLSRIAVINRMMAWTYVQANKMEMDYTVANWALLANSVMNDLKMPLQATNIAASPTCTDPVHKAERHALSGPAWGWYAGLGQSSVSSYHKETLSLNGHNAPQDEVESLTDLTSSLQTGLEAAFTNIKSMNKAITDLIHSSSRIESAIQKVFAANTAEFGAKAKLWFRTDRDLIRDNVEPMTDEGNFLALAGEEQKNSLTQTAGIHWWQPDGVANGFRRTYAGWGLNARFDMGINGWQNTGTPGGCVCYLTKNTSVYVLGSGVVYSDGILPEGLPAGALAAGLTASEIYNKSKSTLCYNTGSNSVRAVPYQVTENFLTKGAVLVGAKLPQTNPLAAVYSELKVQMDSRSVHSWYDAHTLAGKNDFWCMSAARACAGNGSGKYSRTALGNYTPGNTDYTAVMLPVAMAGESAGAVAQEVHAGLNPEGWAALGNWSLLNNFASRGN